jgi:alpha-ketoglutarate-dependent taurine dioxygenase
MKNYTARHLDQTILHWRTEFRLSPEQAQRVRDIERDFHGTGNPFTLPARTPQEVSAHHREIAATMNVEDGERFLLRLEGDKRPH